MSPSASARRWPTETSALSHAHLLARCPQREACTPIQPVCAGREALAPAAPCIELVEHHQQFIGRGLDARRQLGDGIAKDGRLGLTLQACSLIGEVRRGLEPFKPDPANRHRLRSPLMSTAQPSVGSPPARPPTATLDIERCLNTFPYYLDTIIDLSVHVPEPFVNLAYF